MRLLFTALACLISVSLVGQVTNISVEEYIVHSGTVGTDDLTGYTTYHVYANTTNPEDFVSAVYGNASNPLSLSVDGDIFHSAPFSADFAQEVNPLFFSAGFQSLEFDSWLTIGILNSDDNGETQNVLSLSDVDTGEIIFDALADFNSTGSFFVDNPIGGSWFNSMPCAPLVNSNCYSDYPQFGGDDNKVLLAQITTNGSFCGVFNLQVFNGGDQDNNDYLNGLGFCSNPGETFGCTNEDATNFDPTATVDDYTCVLPCTLELIVESAVSPTCPGDNNGSLIITSTGAQGDDYYYLGEGDESASNFGNFNNLSVGAYYVMVTDDAGCEAFQIVEVPEVPEVVVNATLTQGMTCNDINDAIIEVEGTGGTGDLQFYFQGDDPSTMSSTMIYTDLGEGSYTIIAIDENGCLDNSLPVQINNPPAINVYITGYADASCANIADGVIIAAITGGSYPTTNQFLIDGVTYESSPIEISGGTYLVEAIDINGCTGSAAEEITIGPDAILINSDSTPVSCTDDEDGSIAWAPSGGVGDFLIGVTSKEDGSDGENMTTSELGGLSPGFYTIEVVDANGCTVNEIVEVENAPAIEVATETVDVLCNGDSNGSVVVSATGGTGEFSYSSDEWVYSKENEFENLSAGQYVFYVQDGNACETTVSAIIDEPAELVVTGLITNSSYEGDGSINVYVTGGTPDYSYSWSGPGVNGTNTQDLDGASAGTYTLEVIDGNGCTVVQQFLIQQLGCSDPDACNYDSSVTISDGSCTYIYLNDFVNLDVQTNPCYGSINSISWTPTDSTEEFSISLFKESGLVIATDSTGYGSVGNLGGAGWVYIEVTNSNGCTSPPSKVGFWVGPPITIEVETTNNLCNGDSNGIIFAYASGGLESLYYSYEDYTSMNPIYLDSLTAGEYIIYVEDSAGCEVSTLVVITDPDELEVTASATDEIANVELGVGTATAIGGTGYYNVVWTDSLGNVVDPGGLAAGTYIVTVEDDNGCTASTIVEVEFVGIGCTFQQACNYDPDATIDDGSCEFICYGCTDSGACNYNSTANTDDESCEYESCAGCMDEEACNYDDSATINDECDFPEEFYDCNEACINDTDEDGICDELEIYGCTEQGACNYSSDNTEEDGSCEYESCSGCQYELACNYDPNATIADNASCEFGTCDGCLDPLACNYNPTVAGDDGSCEFCSCNDCTPGCTDETACNYDELATEDDGSCTQDDECGICGGNGISDGDCDCYGNQLDAIGICGGSCTSDFNSNGVCDLNEIFGCTYVTAINYNEEATADDGSCEFEETVSNDCIADLDGSGNVGSPDLLLFLGAYGEVCE